MSTPEVLLVTGGGRGIGAAIVRRGAQRGYRVCFSYLQDQTSADRLISEIAAAGHEPPLAVRGDVADPAFPERFFDAAEAAFGPVSALVNNAG
ncbi:MAG TPA: SDR family NAD(P)-dependent oxidoreductase, partial [Alphaproteobacteria bacterium]|nr:SDR family NAD(P)-dependent oxidoreductase [Alphaproteobacteria bacterium]